MNLKESYRYQKKLEGYIEELEMMLSYNTVIKQTKIHKKSSAINADDVIETVQSDVPYTADEIVRFMEYLIHEKEKLTYEIIKTKRCIEDDIDARIQINLYRRTVCDALKSVLRFIPKEKTIVGNGYTFNAEGNQVSYVYDIDIKEEYAYDRDKTKALYDKLVTKADEISDDVELAMLNADVDYKPFYTINDNLDDAIHKYLNM